MEASVFCEDTFFRPNRKESKKVAGQSRQDVCDSELAGLEKKIRTIFFGRRIPLVYIYEITVAILSFLYLQGIRRLFSPTKSGGERFLRGEIFPTG